MLIVTHQNFHGEFSKIYLKIFLFGRGVKRVEGGREGLRSEWGWGALSEIQEESIKN